MSISLDKLSLLGSLSPLRVKADKNISSPDTTFAEHLEQASTLPEYHSETVNSKAKELAESLTLQMLQSSISLSGEQTSEATGSPTTSLMSSVNALMQAYRSNLAEEGKATSSPSADSPLQTVSASQPDGAAALVISRSESGRDTSWLEPIIARASQKYGVDVGLIKAVIKAESNFNPQAVSHAGARGLMQLMPATARSLGVDNSFDPEQNVMAGTRFLKNMLHRYDGNVDSALAAYNWGPGNVDRRPDSLPRETRDYLARVKSLYASYTG